MRWAGCTASERALGWCGEKRLELPRVAQGSASHTSPDGVAGPIRRIRRRKLRTGGGPAKVEG